MDRKHGHGGVPKRQVIDQNERGKQMTRTIYFSSILAAFAAFASPSLAHVMLETKQAPVGASYKAVFGVPHGCEGSPTLEVSIDIPEGVIAVKPMPKPGWKLTTEKGAYAGSYKYFHGGPRTEGVKRVTWSGGELLDEHFDQFVLATYVARELQPGTIYFPVTQKCTNGELHWNEIPAAGQNAHDLDHPAAGLRLVANDAGGGHGHHDHAAAGDIALSGAWSRPVAKAGGVGGGYVKIDNKGQKADALVGGSTDIAERLEIHETTIDDQGVARMKKVDQLAIEPGKSVELKPGGLHLMFIGLKQPLATGDKIKVKLDFKEAGPRDVEFKVDAAGAAAGADEHHHHH